MHSGPRSYHLGSSQARTRAEDEFVNKMRNKLLLTLQPPTHYIQIARAGGRGGGRYKKNCTTTLQSSVRTYTYIRHVCECTDLRHQETLLPMRTCVEKHKEASNTFIQAFVHIENYALHPPLEKASEP